MAEPTLEWIERAADAHYLGTAVVSAVVTDPGRRDDSVCVGKAEDVAGRSFRAAVSCPPRPTGGTRILATVGSRNWITTAGLTLGVWDDLAFTQLVPKQLVSTQLVSTQLVFTHHHVHT